MKILHCVAIFLTAFLAMNARAASEITTVYGAGISYVSENGQIVTFDGRVTLCFVEVDPPKKTLAIRTIPAPVRPFPDTVSLEGATSSKMSDDGHQTTEKPYAENYCGPNAQLVSGTQKWIWDVAGPSQTSTIEFHTATALETVKLLPAFLGGRATTDSFSATSRNAKSCTQYEFRRQRAHYLFKFFRSI